MNKFLRNRIKRTWRASEWFLHHKECKSMWYVYILECADKTYYTGITKDIERRLHEHNKTAAGAKYTRCRRPVLLVDYCNASTRSEALKIEYKIKSQKRNKKLQLLRSYK